MGKSGIQTISPCARGGPLSRDELYERPPASGWRETNSTTKASHLTARSLHLPFASRHSPLWTGPYTKKSLGQSRSQVLKCRPHALVICSLHLISPFPLPHAALAATSTPLRFKEDMDTTARKRNLPVRQQLACTFCRGRKVKVCVCASSCIDG